MSSRSQCRWRIAPDQRLLFEDFDDGVVMFDAAYGATHLLNASAAETLAIVAQHPGLDEADIYRQLLQRLDIAEEALPQATLTELLWRLEELNLVCASVQ